MNLRAGMGDPACGRLERPALLVLASTFPRWDGDHEPPFVLELSRRLAGEFEVHVLVPHALGAARQEKLHGVTVHRFRYAPQRWQTLTYEGGILSRLRQNRLRFGLVLPFLLAQAFAIRQLLTERRFAVVHSHWIIPQTLALRLATVGMRNTPPVLCTSHGGDLFGLQGRLLGWIKGWALRRCAAMTVVSRAMVPMASKLAPHLCPEVVPMGTDLAQTFTPHPAVAREPAVALFVGRLVEKKGASHLLEAVAKILPKHPTLQLWVVGKGPDEQRLKERASKADLAGHVRFLGGVFHAALPDFYRTAGLTVMPSESEGFGLVVVEAIGCECPLIASDLPALRDIVPGDDFAMLVPPGDIDALATALDRLLSDPAQSLVRAQHARQRVLAQFDWSVISAVYGKLLRQMTT